MPPRKSTKGKAPPKRTRSKKVEEEEIPQVIEEVAPEVQPVEEESSKVEGGKAPEPQIPAAQEEAIQEDAEGESEDTHMVDSQPGPSTSAGAQPATLQDRTAKLEALRLKMRESAQANRKELVSEHQKQKTNARELARLEKKMKLAETLREKVDAEENGVDYERKRNWEYSIEENDAWEKKQARKARRADFEFHDYQSATHRKYKKDLDLIKPDLVAYNRQKEIAMGLPSGTLVASTESGQEVVVASSSAQQLASDDLYRDANSLIYGDNKPSEEAIDRVVNKLNNDLDKRGKFSRKRLNEDEGDITYINERNRVFNKKIARYYDKYTSEIRASFERGTAL